MNKFECKNDWTKEKMKAQIRKLNNGTRATGENDKCQYKTPNGNRCFVGCFISNDHAALDTDLSAFVLTHLSLKNEMPLDMVGMSCLQTLHDANDSEDGLLNKAEKWIDDCVYEEGEINVEV